MGQTIKRAPPGSKSFTLLGAPVPKPRQTKKDKWLSGAKARPEVARYRAWADQLRLAAPTAWLLPVRSDTGIVLSVTLFLPMPKSWPSWKTAILRGKPHLTTPDISNLVKAVEDAIWPSDDSMVFLYRECGKFWDDGAGARAIVSAEFLPLDFSRSA